MTHIRPATAQDEPALSRIYNEVRREQFPWVDAAKITEGDLRRDSEDEEIFVEERDGEILGFIAIWVPDSFVHHLFVALRHQGQGTGSRLLEFAQRWYAWPLHLKCVEANARALSFYKQRGGVVLERGLYEEVPFLLMEMPLLDADE
ncbi:MAG: GNAT family N-acetyltransferase [Verrucomicrobiota bacterium]